MKELTLMLGRALRPVALLLVISVGAALLSRGISALALPTSETITDQIPYHGVLYLDGEAVSGRLSMTFSIYDGADATSATWTESHHVQVVAGRFSAKLGGSEDISAWAQAADDLYVEVAIKTPSGETVTLPHRRRLLSAPGAIVSEAFTATTLRGEVRLESASKSSGSDDDAPVIIRDADGHLLKIDGNQLDSDTTLHLNRRSNLGVEVGGEIDVTSGDLYMYASNGVGGLALYMRSNGTLEVNPNGDFTKIVLDSAFTRTGYLKGLDPVGQSSAGCFDKDLVEQIGTGTADYDCQNDAYIKGGRFEGDYDDGKAVKSRRCCKIAPTIE